ncbi:hypothetical protein AB0K18_42965 [Nonomuraea sp. NPDC049421]|uniref:hypothetical protein n=1 Tax=Nonomuraea sp. NPDC049421 TaxID=3155275 RepID=UPI0034438048
MINPSFWEYKTARLDGPHVEEQLNELGQQSWELVHLEYHESSLGRNFTTWYWCVFKRQGIS